MSSYAQANIVLCWSRSPNPRAEHVLGDHYPLTHQQRSPAAWSAYHLYLPCEPEGMILALPRTRSALRAMTFEFLTSDPAKRWKLEDHDSGQWNPCRLPSLDEPIRPGTLDAASRER